MIVLREYKLVHEHSPTDYEAINAICLHCGFIVASATLPWQQSILMNDVWGGAFTAASFMQLIEEAIKCALLCMKEVWDGLCDIDFSSAGNAECGWGS